VTGGGFALPTIADEPITHSTRIDHGAGAQHAAVAGERAGDVDERVGRGR
jgi:hypothetical protein